MNLIELAGVSKVFKTYARESDRVKEFLSLGRRPRHSEHWALQDVSLEIRKGETFCVIGENGSGKTTLLKIIGGIVRPTGGSVKVSGRVNALLELGSGFNNEFSGRENVFLNGALLGLSTQEVEAKLDDILSFAEIGEFIDQPLKTYSSGMVVRLAFAVAVQLDPEILIVDEALSVGDVYFSQRCMRKIHELREQGVTIIFVSHSIADVKTLGERTLWLENGRIRELGETRDVAQNYLAALVEKDAGYQQREPPPVRERLAHREPPPQVAAGGFALNAIHRGDGHARVLGIEVLDDDGRTIERLEPLAGFVVRVSARADHEVATPIIGIQLRTGEGADFAGTSSEREGTLLPPMASGEIVTVDFHFQIPAVRSRAITFTPAIADGTISEFTLCDMVEDAVSIPVAASDPPVAGQLGIPCSISWVAREPAKVEAGADPRPNPDLSRMS